MAVHSSAVIATASPDWSYDTAAEAEAGSAVPIWTAAATSALRPVFEAVQLRALAADTVATVHCSFIYHCRLDHVI
jgi:hypothetical protein